MHRKTYNTDHGSETTRQVTRNHSDLTNANQTKLKQTWHRNPPLEAVTLPRMHSVCCKGEGRKTNK